MTRPYLKLGREHLFCGVFAAFLNSGNLKADLRMAWVPVDLTLFFAIILAAIILGSLFRDEHRVAGSQILWAMLFIGLVLPGILLAPGNDYAASKSLFVATLTPLAFIAGTEVAQRPDGLKRLAAWLVMFGLLISSDALVNAFTSGGAALRASGFGGTTIALGASAGLVFLMEGTRYLLWKASLPRQILSLVLAMMAATALLFSGSKGPLIAALVAIMVMLLASGRKDALGRFLTLGGLTAIGLVFSWSFMPTGSLGRLSSFFAGDFGDSETYRLLALRKALPLLASHPFGIGWGGFVGVVSRWDMTGRQYVHNLLVELWMEGGWITGVGFLLMARRSRFLIRQHADCDEQLLWIGLAIFTFFSALVSGDINDNRLLFALLGFGLGRYARRPWIEAMDNGSQPGHSFSQRRGPCEFSN